MSRPKQGVHHRWSMEGVAMGFEGKVSIITGGGQGIGKVIAHRLASQGGAVVISDIDLETARSTAEEIESSLNAPS